MKWMIRIAATAAAAFFVACFLVLDPIGQAIAAGAIAASSGALIALAIQQRARYDDAAPAALRGWVLDPEDEAAASPVRVLRVERVPPQVLTARPRALPGPAPTMRALPGPSPLLMATDAEYADWLALYAAWTGPEAEVDAATQAEIAAWEWDDPGDLPTSCTGRWGWRSNASHQQQHTAGSAGANHTGTTAAARRVNSCRLWIAGGHYPSSRAPNAPGNFGNSFRKQGEQQ